MPSPQATMCNLALKRQIKQYNYWAIRSERASSQAKVGDGWDSARERNKGMDWGLSFKWPVLHLVIIINTTWDDPIGEMHCRITGLTMHSAMNIPQTKYWETQVNKPLPHTWTYTGKKKIVNEWLPLSGSSIYRKQWLDSTLPSSSPVLLSLSPFSPSSQSHSMMEDNLEPDWLMQPGRYSGWPGLNSRALSHDALGWQKEKLRPFLNSVFIMEASVPQWAPGWRYLTEYEYPIHYLKPLSLTFSPFLNM